MSAAFEAAVGKLGLAERKDSGTALAGGGPNALRPIETPRVPHAARQCGGDVAARGGLDIPAAVLARADEVIE